MHRVNIFKVHRELFCLRALSSITLFYPSNVFEFDILQLHYPFFQCFFLIIFSLSTALHYFSPKEFDFVGSLLELIHVSRPVQYHSGWVGLKGDWRVSDVGLPGYNKGHLFVSTSEVSLAVLGWWPASAQTLWEMLWWALVCSLWPAPLIVLWPPVGGVSRVLDLGASGSTCSALRSEWVASGGMGILLWTNPNPASSPLGLIRVCPSVQAQRWHGRTLAWEGLGLSGVWWVFTQVVSCGHKVCSHSAYAST